VLNGIGQYIQARIGKTACKGDVKDRLIIGGIGIDRSSHGLNFPGHLTDLSLLCPLEDHVLDEMAHPRFFIPFISTAHIDPDLEGHHRSVSILLEDHFKAIIERKLAKTVL
jgi:hypothetical protein